MTYTIFHMVAPLRGGGHTQKMVAPLRGGGVKPPKPIRKLIEDNKTH